MKISVITPVLNGVRFLRKTIESVLVQHGDFELEYIIKDGGSIDGTKELLEEFAEFPSVRIVSKKDRSLYDAINQGFTYATGEIGCWINADDYYEPGALQKIVTVFAQHPEIHWVYGRCNIVDANGKKIRNLITLYKSIIGWHYSYNMLSCENYINQPATFWRMDLWRKVNGLDMGFPIAADYHLWLKFAQQSKAVAVHKKLANFRRCGESISDKKFQLQFLDELAAAKLFCTPLTYSVHAFNCWKIILIYKLLERINTRNR
jgi:GT2 family glycosyltransferase